MADAARARRIADRIKVVVAANLEHLVKDPDLGFVTVTDARVTNDLQHATLFYTVFGDKEQRERTAALLDRHKGRLRSFVGQQIGIRLTPTLDLVADAVPETAAHVDELLKEARQRDADTAAVAASAQYAGEPDPYRRPADDEAAHGGNERA